MAPTGCCFLVAFGLSNFFLATSALLDHHGDALALVQQRARVKPHSTSLTRILEDSFRTQPTAYAEIIDKVIQKAGEAKLHHFWQRMMEIGQARNMTREERGLLLVQESAKVITNGDEDDSWLDWIWDSRAYKWLTKDKSEPHACLASRGGAILDIADLAVAIAYPVGKKCDIEGLCAASALDIMRALVYLARESTAAYFSHCAEKISYPSLCGASSMGVFAEMTGVVHSSISLKYKCKSNTYNPSAESKIFGLGAQKVLCGWDVTRGAAFAITGIYRAFWFFAMGYADETYVDDTDGSLWRPTRGELEAGQSGPAYGFMALGGFAWMANALTTVITNCPDESREVTKRNPACGKEVLELLAYVFQTFGWGQNVRDYCLDVYDKNQRRKGSTDKGNTEQRFKEQVIKKIDTMTIHNEKTDHELWNALHPPLEPTNDQSGVIVNEEVPNSDLTKQQQFGRDIARMIEEDLANKDLLKVSGGSDPMESSQRLPEVIPDLSGNQLETGNVAKGAPIEPSGIITASDGEVDTNKVNPEQLTNKDKM